MFRIFDVITEEWLKSVPWDNKVEHTNYSKQGRVFSRRGDVSTHISQNIKFYSQFPTRFEIVECDLVEIDRQPILTALKAKQDRDIIKIAENKKALALSNLRHIELLKKEIEKLTGKD
jgi:hypothetical protein